MQRIRWTGLIALSSAVLLVPRGACAQISAKVEPPAPATAAQVAKLEVALQKVSSRVTELEQAQTLDVDDDELTQANLVKMQDVIARLAKSMGETQKLLDATRNSLASAEKTLAAMKASQAQLKAVGDAEADGARVVRAPFVVVNGAGKTLFRVEQGASTAGHVIVGDPAGDRITLGAGVSGGVGISMIYGGVPRVTLFGSPAYSAVTAFGGGSSAWVAAHPEQGGYVGLTSDQGKNIAQMLMRKGRGYFELNDGAGTKMVEAGSLDAGRGYVLVNPSRVNIDAAGNPSVLLGGGKK